MSTRIKNRHGTIRTHHIGDWKIEESLEPFPQKENHSISFSNESNVQQWNIDDVCLFVEHVLGKNRYTSIIREHLIDGISLLLLKEEHLNKVFHMPTQERLKLLQRIDKLQM